MAQKKREGRSGSWPTGKGGRREVRFSLDRVLEVTYYLQSGFSCAWGDTLLVFDYWQGERGRLREEKRLTQAALANYREVVVFVSHSHEDHFDQVIESWRTLPNIRYVISYELPLGTEGIRMRPGDTCQPFPDVSVKAFDSTDLGVSYLVELAGIRIFHAGDLNFWHWREESTLKEIDEAEEAFRAAVEPITHERIDLAFFPVDQRQGRLFDAGANYFIMSAKPRLLIPMHFWGRAEIAIEFARRARCRQTEVVAMTRQGEKMRLDMAEDGFMTVHILAAPDPTPLKQDLTPGPVNLSGYEEGEDPFINSDLPIKWDVDE